MKQKHVDAARETRLWIGQIIKPAADTILGVGLLSREFGFGETLKQKKRQKKIKKADFTVFDRTEPKKVDKKKFMTDEDRSFVDGEYADAYLRLKRLENIGKQIPK